MGDDPADILLLGEVVSPSSRKTDRLFKPAEYAEAGIKPYWRLELDPEPLLVVHALVGTTYQVVQQLTGTGRVTVPFEVDLDLPALLPRCSTDPSPVCLPGHMPSGPLFVVEQVSSPVTWLLRQQLLHPTRPVRDMALPGDDDASSAHFAAYDVSGPAGSLDEICGVASVLRAEEPEAAGVPAQWRLRAFATLERVRGQGVGRALLARVVDHVGRTAGLGSTDGDTDLWANARLPALGFYLAEGFEVMSAEFVVEGVGPHIRVRRTAQV